MEQHGEFSFDINFDFLDSSTTNTAKQNTTTTAGYEQQVPPHPTFDIESLATKIASVNELAVLLKEEKDAHTKLQKQMQDLSHSAMSIRSIYEKEKTEKAKYALLSKELQDKCDQAESQLANKTLHFEQLTSKIEQSLEKGPLSYNELALRYQRLALQLDGEKQLHPKEKPSLQQMQEYIESKKLTALQPFKRKNIQSKKQVHDYAIQCNLRVETKTQSTQHTSTMTSRGTSTDFDPAQKEMCTQGTQSKWCTMEKSTNTPAFQSEPQKQMKTQGTQYISSTTTRGTCTSAFIKKQNIGTNFPEVTPISIEDIFKEMICDVSPLSPMAESPPRKDKEVLPAGKVETKSVGTNTGLKNVRKLIDYVPQSIKHSDSRPPSRNMYDRIKNESPFMGLPPINPYAGIGMSPPPMQSSVAELWNMLGNTIFALLQNGSASFNPMHMNVVNDRMRNLNADMARHRERQRSSDERSNSGKEFFDEEDLNNPRDYIPRTRSTATSPILSTELENSEDHGSIDGTYTDPATSSSAFLLGQRIGSELNVPVEIQKILLNKNHRMEACKIDYSSEKSSQVDEIQKLSPTRTHSLQKRKAIKGLLRTSNLNKKTKKKTKEGEGAAEDFSHKDSEFSFLKIKSQNPTQTKWKEALFSTSDGETISSQCLSLENSKMPTHVNESEKIHGKIKSTVLRSVPPGQAFIESSESDDFRGFEESSTTHLHSDEVFCKPFLPPKRKQTALVANPFNLNAEKEDEQIQEMGNGTREKFEVSCEPFVVNSLKKKTSNAKRKRPVCRSDIVQSSKIYKSESSFVGDEEPPSIFTNQLGLQNEDSQTRKSSDFNSMTELAEIKPLNFLCNDPKTSNFTEISMPGQIEAPSTSFHHQRISNLSEKTAARKRTFKNVGQSELAENGFEKPLKSDALQMQRALNLNKFPMLNQGQPQGPLFEDENTCNSIETTTFRQEISPNSGMYTPSGLISNDTTSQRLVNSSNQFIFSEYVAPQDEKTLNLNFNDFVARSKEETSTFLFENQNTIKDVFKGFGQEKPHNAMPQHLGNVKMNDCREPGQENTWHTKKKANAFEHSSKMQESVNTVLNNEDTLSFKSRQKKPVNLVIPDQKPKNSNKSPPLREEKSPSPMLCDQNEQNSNGIAKEQILSNTELQDQALVNCNNLSSSSSVLVIQRSLHPQEIADTTMSEKSTLLKERQNLNNESGIDSLKCADSLLCGHSTMTSSGSESDLIIDYPESPKSYENPLMDLSSLLKTPEKDSNTSQCKTPDSGKNNSSLDSNVLTSTTEDLVDDFLFNENSVASRPKFQIFLDRILSEVAPPLSPVSVLAPSENPLSSDTDEESKLHLTCQKTKKKLPPTAAIAINRSARLKAKNGTVNSLNLLSIPGIQLGKYTKRPPEQKNLLKKLPEVKKVEEEPEKEEETPCDFEMGFFRDILEEKKEHDSAGALVIDTKPEYFKQDENGVPPDPMQSKEICQRTSLQKNSLTRLNSLLHGEGEALGSNSNQKSEQLYQRLPEINLNQNYFSTSHWHREHEITGKHNPTTLEEKPNQCCKRIQEMNLFSNSHKDTTSVESKKSDEHSILSPEDGSAVFASFNKSPASPPPIDQLPEETFITQEVAESEPVMTKPNRNSLISHIIANYNPQYHKMLVQVQQNDKKLLAQLQDIINSFISGLCLVMDSIRTVDTLLNITTSETLMAQAFIGIVKTAPRPETEVAAPVPDLYLSQTLCKLLSLLEPLHHHLPGLRKQIQVTIEHSLFTFTKDIIPLEVIMNYTQFYLAIIADPTAQTNPARLFICKCLYFYNQKATPMIYETLCVYPSVLPKREDLSYDRSDALINTIQCLLMSTYYDTEKTDMKTKQILTKLRKFYNYESFKPPRDEVIENLMAKIRAGRIKNVSYAFALICKRMEQGNTEKIVLGSRLLPLANEYYHAISQTTENDEKIACVLECISFIIKPFSLDTDISMYVNLFGRFLNASERQIVQEAALAALLRTMRFGYVHCFNAIYNFKPNYELANSTKAMLRSFVYKKGVEFLKRLERQAHVLVAN